MSNKEVVVILLAGGVGSRINAPIPKQYLMLDKKPIALHSFDVFQFIPEVVEIVVVCNEAYQELFKLEEVNKKLTFALPGNRRQDSAYNGFSAIKSKASLVCIHDAARPFIDKELIQDVIEAGHEFGAATLGMPLKYTVKCATKENFVSHTPDRKTLWEIQTPQVMDKKLLEEGFLLALKQNLTVTDEASLIEKLNRNVKIVEGSYRNIKITTKEDIYLSEQLIKL